ncbi:hypothetical protein B5F24_16415 [Bacteroides clarus]|jgi:predicted DNA-binding transcriptional regulator AlpA|uniref:Helix-turn-helix domain-containing protein n=1 Tax=Bacteroides clarus TaxID=626929 RepID=A0A1Y4JIQ5_9BACE|nr:helix-turn-helix domain-containing protein [Bacteroides clarus]OUP31666.1 hypothetical protein B5F24_16415 [Bacteroides clarus]
MDIREIIRNSSSSQQLLIVSVQDLKKAFLEWDEEIKANIRSTPDDKLVPLKEVAEVLKVNRTTLYHWSKKGYLIPIKIGGKVFYRQNDINEIR